MKKSISENRRGLVGHWKYHGNVSAAGTWKDVSGNGKNGTLAGNTYIDNQGANFDGGGDYIDLSNSGSPLIPATSNWTLILWVNNSQNVKAVFFSQYTASSANGRFYITRSWIDTTKIALFLGDDSQGNPSYTWEIAALSTGWNFIAISRSGALFSAFVNGSTYTYTDYATRTLQQTGNIFGAQSTSTVYNVNLSSYVSGKMDDIRIYNRALSAEEVQQIYYQTKGRY